MNHPDPPAIAEFFLAACVLIALAVQLAAWLGD